jgi:hypothetical protein
LDITKEATMETIVKILLNDRKAPARKLADAELHFRGGELDGLKLIGFALWERRDHNGFDVTFPSREFTVDGRRRRYSLLRAISDPAAQDRVRDLVLRVYAEVQQPPSSTLSAAAHAAAER